MILITGASGFVGRHLVSKLEPRKEVRCLVRQNSETSRLAGCELVKGDITDFDSLVKATKGVSAVIHLTAALGAASYEENYRTHVDGARNLIDACKTNGVRRIVVASTVATLAERKSDYGTTKKMADELFMRSGLDITILKPDFIYGSDGRGFMTLVDVIRKGKFVPVIGDGKYRRQPVHVDDVAASFYKALGAKHTGKTYIIAGAEPIEFDEMVNMIMNSLGISKRKVHIPIWLTLLAAKMMKLKKNPRLTQTVVLGIAQDRFADVSPMINELGVKPRSFGAGLEQVMAEIKNS